MPTLPTERVIRATYLDTGRARGPVRLLPPGASDPASAVRVEELVARHLVGEGMVVLRAEIKPFVNFLGALLYPLVRSSPTSGHVFPTQAAAREALARLPTDTAGLVAVFESRLAASAETRNGLSFPVNPAEEAAALVALQVLAPPQVVACVEYLVERYWERRAGWPDLIAFRLTEGGPADVELLEVKSRRDQLSKNQRAWLDANQTRLGLPCRLVRVLGEDDLEIDPGYKWPYRPPTTVWAPEHLHDHPLLAPALAADARWRSDQQAAVDERRARNALLFGEPPAGGGGAATPLGV